MPITVTAASTMNVAWYRLAHGSLSGSARVISAVTGPPIRAIRKIRVWMRPRIVGNNVLPLDLAAAGPLDPLDGRADRSHLAAEAAVGDVVDNLLGGDLQAQERVHAGEVAAVGGGTG